MVSPGRWRYPMGSTGTLAPLGDSCRGGKVQSAVDWANSLPVVYFVTAGGGGGGSGSRNSRYLPSGVNAGADGRRFVTSKGSSGFSGRNTTMGAPSWPWKIRASRYSGGRPTTEPTL